MKMKKKRKNGKDKKGVEQSEKEMKSKLEKKRVYRTSVNAKGFIQILIIN